MAQVTTKEGNMHKVKAAHAKKRVGHTHKRIVPREELKTLAIVAFIFIVFFIGSTVAS